MSEQKVVATMMPKQKAPAKKKATAKKKAVAKKKAAPKKRAVVKKKAVKKPTVKKIRARDDKGHFVADDPNTPENEAWVEAKPQITEQPELPLPEVERPEDFDSNMGVYKRDKDAVTFLVVVAVLAALVIATGML